jgi:hypothetical protein
LQKFPILAKTAFLLVGYVGFILLAELIFHFHVHSWQKFIGVVIISTLSLLYSRVDFVHTLLKPLVIIGQPLMRLFAALLDGVFWPLRKLHEAVTKVLRRPAKEGEDQTPA